MITVSIVDDHQLVVEGFARLVNLQKDMQVNATYSSYSEASAQMAANPPDIMLIDISLPDKSGIDLAIFIRQHHPAIKIIMLSMHDTEPYISKALSAGASGFLSKRVASDELIQAIHAVLSDAIYLSQDVKNNQSTYYQDKRITKLTQREYEVFKLLAQSKAIKTIATLLDLQPKTVHAHKANICKKLDVSNLEEIRRLALKHQIINVDDLV